MTAVLVQRAPFGSSSFSEAVCDVFEKDTLTVSSSDGGFDAKYGPLQVFKAGTWFEATVYDERGYPLAHYISEFSKRQRAASAAIRKVS